ncbi:MAG: esterase/lipase family protein [Panacagrimonas sp.]
MNGTKLVATLAILAVSLLQACGGGGSPDAVMEPEPELKALQTDLDDALNCTPFRHPDKPPVLLVSGTVLTGTEQFTLCFTSQLVDLGYDVCILTYPDRGFGDLQVSAEYVVNALRSLHAETGGKVAMIGHSQGAVMPRWALKFWPSAREAVSDFVMLAGYQHGTNVALPGDLDYTAIYTRFDELVRPLEPVPTAALDFGRNNPHVTNILLQDVCPGYLSDHATIGLTDPVAFALALDAIGNPGPADVMRAGGPSELCGLLPIDVVALLQAPLVTGLLEIVADLVASGIPRPHLAAAEPILMDYAAGEIAP